METYYTIENIKKNSKPLSVDASDTNLPWNHSYYNSKVLNSALFYEAVGLITTQFVQNVMGNKDVY